MSSFELVGKARLNDVIDVFKFKSEATGLKVVLADIEGPVVNGHFVLATEAHDDDGLPHTLEHLIFLGSEKYPFKGVLDLLANRCLASGTNAWTDTDHTCYTMTTAGSDGFLKLLPIYLDHILYPTLTDSGFITEVHHVSGEGEDGGVVYCEMQGRENTGESRANLQLLRLAYPNSGYSSETGGIMKNLRTSTNNEKVRAYHAEFYRPENLTIIVTGKVKAEQVFKALQPLEKKILSKNKNEPFVRPWQTPVDSIKESQDVKILYPSDEEDCGLIYMGFHGPHCVEDNLSLTGCVLLLRYLTDTAVSPLQQEFVETDDPYASKVSYGVVENLVSLLYVTFEDVPIAKIDSVRTKFEDVLKKFVNGEEKIDMKRMRSIIEKEILECLSSLEGSPHDTAAFLIIGDVIYGQTQQDFERRLNAKKELETFFLKVDENYWIDLLRKFLVEGNYICVRAYPSIEEQARMTKDELERIEKQRNALGSEGLNHKEKELRDAMQHNEKLPPDEMLTEVEVPSIENINFHYLQVFKPTDLPNFPDTYKNVVNFSDFPSYAEVYDIHTNFIYIFVTLNTREVENNLRPYLLLLLDMILECPVRKDGKLIPYEEVVAALERDTITTEAELGLESGAFSCGPYSTTAIITMEVHPSKYESVVTWIKDLLHLSEFPVERIRTCASKMSNAISQAKRKGNSIVRDLLKAMYYEPDSNVQVSSMLKQQKFLGSILEKLNDPDKAQKIMDDLYTLRNTLTKPENIGVHLAANLSKLSKEDINLSSLWKDFVKENTLDKRLNFVPDWKTIRPEGLDPEFQGTVVGIGSVESSFLFHSAPSINDFLDPDLPAVMLFLQYLTQLEGPLWKQIRGQGFAYGYNIAPRPHEGLICLTLYRATNVVAAFKEMKNTIENQLNQNVWDSNLLESARSSLIFEIIERERSIGNLVHHCLLASFKQVPASYNHELVKQVNKVTENDLHEAGRKYVASLFSSKAKTAIVCHPEKVQEIVTAFQGMDRQLAAVSSLEESILGK